MEQERTNSQTVEVLRLSGGAARSATVWGEFRKDNGRIVTVEVRPTFAGILLAVGFVGTGGRHIS